jgi:hypothetical protein
VLRESSFSYAGYSIIRMATYLPAPCFHFRPVFSHLRWPLSFPSASGLQRGPNAITQSLLAQISQQLPESSNATTSNASPSINAQDPFSPATAVFVNSVWFVSLVLSLVVRPHGYHVATMDSPDRQLTQRNYPPRVRAHIREYFSQSSSKHCLPSFPSPSSSSFPDSLYLHSVVISWLL